SHDVAADRAHGRAAGQARGGSAVIDLVVRGHATNREVGLADAGGHTARLQQPVVAGIRTAQRKAEDVHGLVGAGVLVGEGRAGAAGDRDL
nr:hypothetical protein [Tanacetum cinerariifolium]